MNARNLWAQVLTVTGGIATVVGGVDPLEGSLLILPGSALLALGAWLGCTERRVIGYRISAFLLMVLGWVVLWAMIQVAGIQIGGPKGRPWWWVLPALVPFLAGWNMAVWGPRSPRWLLWLGILYGLAQLASAGSIGLRRGQGALALGLAIAGVVPLAGCLWRLRQQRARCRMTAA